MKVKIASINIGQRHRKDMGDLSGLAESIKAQGLLQPVGITEANELVFGERRIRACKDILKWTEIEARTVNVTSIVEGEFDENEVREDFRPSERVAIARAVEKAVGNRQGQRTDKPVGGGPQVPKGTKTRDWAAKKAGFKSDKSYRQARKVVEQAVDEVVAEMDSGRMSISAASQVASKPKEEQRRIMKAPEAERRRMAKAKKYMREGPTMIEKVQTIEMAIEALADPPLTVSEYIRHATPYGISGSAKACAKIKAYLTQLEKEAQNEPKAKIKAA